MTGSLSGELRSDGLAVDEGVAAEGAVEHGAEPAGVLHGEGVVEAELGAEGLTDLGRVGGLAAAGEDGGSDVAGEGAHDGEDDDGRKERRGEDEGESAGEVGVRHGDGVVIFEPGAHITLDRPEESLIDCYHFYCLCVHSDAKPQFLKFLG